MTRALSAFSRSSFGPSLVVAALGLSGLVGVGCKKDDPQQQPQRGGDVPPPAPSAATKPGGCASPGMVDDSISNAFFPRTQGTFCIDSAPGSVRTYGAQARLSMDEVCTTAFDGECEVYKRFGLKRVVTLRYVDGSGAGGVVEVILSQFDGEPGAYGMFTKRVVADADPASDTAPKAVPASGAAAMGGGRATAWRGAHVLEVVYMNEQEPPAKMVKSSEAVLPGLVKAITDKLPGKTEKPAPASALPEANMIPLGVVYSPKDVLGVKGFAPAATGFYKDNDKRYRYVAAAPADEAAAKELMKAIKAKPGALPVADVGDEGTHVVLQDGKEAPKAEWVFARKGTKVLGIGDEELVLKAGEALDAQKAVRLAKDEKVAKLKAAVAK